MIYRRQHWMYFITLFRSNLSLASEYTKILKYHYNRDGSHATRNGSANTCDLLAEWVCVTHNAPPCLHKLMVAHDAADRSQRDRHGAGIHAGPHRQVVPIEGGMSRRVVATPHQDYHPFVSPSGKWLYFQPDHKNVYRVPGPSQNWRPTEPQKVTNYPESDFFMDDPQISANGRRIIYTHGHLTGDIWLLNFNRGF